MSRHGKPTRNICSVLLRKLPVIQGRSCPAASFGRQKRPDDRPFLVCQTAALQECLLKAFLNHNSPDLGSLLSTRPDVPPLARTNNESPVVGSCVARTSRMPPPAISTCNGNIGSDAAGAMAPFRPSNTGSSSNATSASRSRCPDYLAPFIVTRLTRTPKSRRGQRRTAPPG